MLENTDSTDWLAARCQATPTRIALTFGETAWTFAELDALTNNLCNWVDQQSHPQNRRIGVLMHNGPEYVLLIYAAARLGLTLVTFNSRLAPAEVEWQIGFTQCEFVVTDEANQRTLSGVDAEMVFHMPTLNQLTQWLMGNGQWRIDNGEPAPNPIQSIVFTSGTTGRPKAVPITFKQHFYSAMASAYRLGVQTDDVWLSVLPLYHVGGLAVIFRSLLYGTAVDLHVRFDLTAINHAFDHKLITMISVVPTMLVRMIESREIWPDSLRLILVGGAAASPELVTAAGKLSKTNTPLISTSYGMTEVASQFSTQTPADTAKKPGSVGRPFLFNQIKISDETGVAQRGGEIGEIQVKGVVLMQGYLDNPEANAERFTTNGWFCTGDLGYFDEDGDLFVVQRRSDLILSGGENVYPAEVEAVLRQHPAVKEACVVGLPDYEWGQIVAAMVELIPGRNLTENELIGFSQESLARYKTPRLIEFVSQLPQTASGKIERKQVLKLLSRNIS
ncbi:MAG: O-succinylbenzoic acid--CoA ligase [Cellvibrionaceae bacterium]|jgi:O-succinylbenzoic acid--CoA ligase